jgi:hypothetical protein
MEAPAFSESHNLRMRDHGSLKHLFVVRQELLAAAPVTDKQLPVN